jgi:sugar/nucleoside kinase (ribokinase family)
MGEIFNGNYSDPKILWEPKPAYYLHASKENKNEKLPQVDSIFPNQQETKQVSVRVMRRHAGMNLSITWRPKWGDPVRCRCINYSCSDGNITDCAVPVEAIVDQTGAGNAYCGGLIVGCAQSKDVVAALCQAAVSASFALEQFGALFPMAGLPEKAKDRFDLCMAELQRLN